MTEGKREGILVCDYQTGLVGERHEGKTSNYHFAIFVG